jgi:hypothetical protein
MVTSEMSCAADGDVRFTASLILRLASSINAKYTRQKRGEEQN